MCGERAKKVPWGKGGGGACKCAELASCCVCVWQILEAASEAVHWRLCSFAEVSLRRLNVVLAKWQKRLGTITNESKQVTG